MKRIIFTIGLALSLNIATQDAFSMQASSLTSSGSEYGTPISLFRPSPIRANATPLIPFQPSPMASDTSSFVSHQSSPSSMYTESESGSLLSFPTLPSLSPSSLSSVETPSWLALSIPDDGAIRYVGDSLQHQFDCITSLRGELKEACYNLSREEIADGQEKSSPYYKLLYKVWESCGEIQEILYIHQAQDGITLRDCEKVDDLILHLRMFYECYRAQLPPKACKLFQQLDTLSGY